MIPNKIGRHSNQNIIVLANLDKNKVAVVQRRRITNFDGMGATLFMKLFNQSEYVGLFNYLDET